MGWPLLLLAALCAARVVQMDGGRRAAAEVAEEIGPTTLVPLLRSLLSPEGAAFQLHPGLATARAGPAREGQQVHAAAQRDARVLANRTADRRAAPLPTMGALRQRLRAGELDLGFAADLLRDVDAGRPGAADLYAGLHAELEQTVAEIHGLAARSSPSARGAPEARGVAGALGPVVEQAQACVRRASAPRMGPIPGYEAYSEALVAYPLATKVATAAVLGLLGDLLAQARERQPYDPERAAGFVCSEAVYRGGQHLWFLPWIYANCQGDLLRSAGLGFDQVALSAAESTFANQFLIVPLVYYPLFFGITGYAQGLTTEESLTRWKSAFGPIQLRNWVFWVPANAYQYAVIPIEYQITYNCAMGLVWNVILSVLAGDASKDAGASEDPDAPVVETPETGRSFLRPAARLRLARRELNKRTRRKQESR